MKCVIFDCDGVLVDSDRISCQVLVSMMQDLGLQISLESAFRKFHGCSLQEIFSKIEFDLQSKLPANFETRFRHLSYELFEKNLTPIPGAVAFVRSLSVPFCVASSGPTTKISLNLRICGLLELFEGKIYSSYEINSWKPEPDIYLWAAKNMGFTPDECIVIEDSVHGVVSAVSGGFRVYALATDFNERELKSHGAITVRNFDELSLLFQPNHP